MTAPRRVTTFNQMLEPFQEEFNAFMLGAYIASGESRTVYELPSDPKRWVVKLETGHRLAEFHNVVEWNLWHEMKEFPEARAWLAPCKAISRGGKCLIMARTKPLKGADDLKGIRIPDFLGDCHWQNMGRYKGRIVCHDYAYNRLVRNAGPRFKLVKNDREGDGG